MSKERLEEIEEIDEEVSNGFALEDLDLNTMTVVNRQHFEWLIKQAERVQELEEENRFQMSETHKNLDKVIYLGKENQRYKQALEFYADNMTYNSRFDKETGAWEITDISKDLGEKARQALKGESE